LIVDLAVLALALGIIYALTSEGLWGAALMFFNVLFASLITFNFYEPLAKLIIDNVGNETVSSFADSVSMLLLFAISLLLLRLATESLAPSMVRFPTPLYHLGRFVFAIGGSLIMTAMLLLGYQAAPVQKKILGVWDYKHEPALYKERVDKDFLAFFQYTSGYTFPRNGIGASDKEFPNRPHLFDPEGKWLLAHQQARPYGTEQILEETPEPGATPAAAGGGPPGAPAPGAVAPR
jgi:hypothetical protein